MSRSFFRFGGLISALLSVCSFTRCKPSPSSTVRPGVSIEMSYPVLLIGQDSLDVRDSVEDLIAIHGYSGINLVERVILDSEGRIFEVVEATPEPGGKSWILDMGTSARRFEVIVREKGKQEWPKIRELLLQQVKAPNSYWSGDRRAVAKVESLDSVAEAIDACRTSWEWMR